MVIMKKTKKEVIAQFEELRDEILNFTPYVKQKTNELLKRCKKVEEAVRKLSSDIEIVNNEKEKELDREWDKEPPPCDQL